MLFRCVFPDRYPVTALQVTILILIYYSYIIFNLIPYVTNSNNYIYKNYFIPERLAKGFYGPCFWPAPHGLRNLETPAGQKFTSVDPTESHL
jgi:hypothetical protein